MSSVPHRELPIFPLGTVLFPEGVLPLRIFEARYMDMVRDCLRDDGEFGICLITEGTEVGQPAKHETIGCTARIEQWDMTQLGLLNIRTRGISRFEVVSSTVSTNGLILAEVATLAAEPDASIPSAFAACVNLLERIVNDLVEKEQDPFKRMIGEPYRFDSASWVSCRLCEFLPIPAATKAQLLALNDPTSRLLIIDEYLRQQQVL